MNAFDVPQADSRATWFLVKRASRLHARIYKITRGRVAGNYRGVPLVVFESVGRKSGTVRTHAVTGVPEGDDIVIAASRGGVDRNPAWYYNLMANPETTAWFRGGRRQMRARETRGEERERLWNRLVEANSDYAHYAERTSRHIPVLVLEPAGGSGREVEQPPNGR